MHAVAPLRYKVGTAYCVGIAVPASCPSSPRGFDFIHQLDKTVLLVSECVQEGVHVHQGKRSHGDGMKPSNTHSIAINIDSVQNCDAHFPPVAGLIAENGGR